MKSNKAKKVITGMAVALMAVSTVTTTAFAGTWQQDLGGWRYVQDDGTYKGAGWFLDVDGSWYKFDENGYMQTGWVFENGNWYFLSNKSTDGQTYGKMVTGSNWIDSYNYYFDPATGAMAALQLVDGNFYGQDGCRLGSNGLAATQSIFLDNTNVFTTSQTSGSTSTFVSHSSSGGSSGGSGGSSGSSSRKSSGSSSSSSSRNRSSSDSAWSGYSDTSVSSTSSSFTNGNYSLMTSAQKEAVEEAIEDFKAEYITAGMSDFEKEMVIIQYIVENCEYEKGTNYSNSTAYSVLINGKAQCSGYADAFLQMAKACGLNARYVVSSDHAWNLIELDGDWYHVDVTWEDPTGHDYGFGNLRNLYINLEDTEIKLLDHHKSWSPSTIKCSGYKYGPDVVEEYLRTGNVDTSLGVSYEDFINNSTVSSAEDYVEGAGGEATACNGNVMYKITFRYNENGTSSSYTKISYAYLNERIKINYPNGWTYVGTGEDYYTVKSGSCIFDGNTLMILEADSEGTFAIEIKVTDIKDESANVATYSISYEDDDEPEEKSAADIKETVKETVTETKEETVAETKEIVTEAKETVVEAEEDESEDEPITKAEDDAEDESDDEAADDIMQLKFEADDDDEEEPAGHNVEEDNEKEEA